MLALHSVAQNTPSFQWVRSGGGSGEIQSNAFDDESIKNLGCDNHGNIYCISMFTSYGTYIDSIYSPGFGYDDFGVMSYNCKGDLRWIKRFGNIFSDGAMDIVVDSQGNSYVTGGVLVSDDGPAHFGDSTIIVGDTTLKGNFIIKLDSLGNITWLTFPGPENYIGFPSHMFVEIEFGSNGNPYVFARFNGACSYSGYTIPDSGEYVLEFDKNTGELINLIDLHTKESNTYGKQSTIDNDDNIFILYDITSVNYLIIGIDTISKLPNVSGAQVLVSYNMNGDLQWKQEYWGIHNDTVNTECGVWNKPSFDDNYIYLTGGIQSLPNAHFKGFSINNPFASNQNIRTRFYMRIDKNTGEITRIINLMNYKQILMADICISNGKIYAAGTGGSTIIFNQEDTIFPNTGTTIGDTYPYILEIDTSFNSFNWGIATPATNISYVKSMHVDKNGNIYIGGDMRGTITDSYGNTAATHGNEDYFLAKVAFDNECLCNSTEPTLQVQSFQNNELIITGHFQNNADSAYINWGDGEVSEYLQEGSSTSHQYQNSGPYTVCLQAYNHCGLDEDCAIDLLYADENFDVSGIKIYPNPASEQITIELPGELLSSTIVVQTIDGRIIQEQIAASLNTQISLINLKSGIYLVRLILEDGSESSWRVVRQ